MKLQNEYILLISLYEEHQELRRVEILDCLRINKNIFNKIVILFEIPNKKSQNKVLKEILELKLEKKYKAKIELIFINGRPSYSDFFAICRKYNENQKKYWFCIANSDIFFDLSLFQLENIKEFSNSLIALSRYDKKDNLIIDEIDLIPNIFSFEDGKNIKWSLITIKKTKNLLTNIPNYFSQDAWIFNEIPINWEKYKFKIGTWHCDSFLNTQAKIDKLNIFNPCFTIKIFHNHKIISNDKNRDTNYDQKNQWDTWDKGLEYFSSYDKKNEKFKYTNPIHGVRWSTISDLKNIKTNNIFPWEDFSLFINYKAQSNLKLTLITLEIIYKKTVDYYNKIKIEENAFGTSRDVIITFYLHYDNLGNKVNKILVQFLKNLINEKVFTLIIILGNKEKLHLQYKFLHFKNYIESYKNELTFKRIIENEIFKSSLNNKIVLLEDNFIQILKNLDYEESFNFIEKISKNILNKSIQRYGNTEIAKKFATSEKNYIGIF